MTTKLILFTIATMFAINATSQISLTADFTDDTQKKNELHDIWGVANRISPINGVNVRSDIKVNTVRMVGGIVKTVNGAKVPYPEFDPCTYDSTNNVYVYNWAPLKSRINAILNSGTPFYQFVLDQPPWAFQHGYTFLPEGSEYDGVHFKEEDRITTYGNSLPPYDKKAYYDFIVAMMTELVATYGEEEVLSWRLRVGSEIETPAHWKGSKQDFLEHYANTVRAVLSVLPNAVIGPHTRHPGFIYKEGTVLNYKGEPIASFIDDLIAYCDTSEVVRYDFWGLSNYILINSESHRDIGSLYSHEFAALVSNDKWVSNTPIDYHEYKVVTTMKAEDNGGTMPCVTSHAETFNVALSHLFYQNRDKGLSEVFRWSQRTGSTEEISVKMVNSMLGKARYNHTKNGTPAISNNLVDAIFSKSDNTNEIDALVYNFNYKSIAYKAAENVELAFRVALPVGDTLYYRILEYGEEQNDLQVFMKNEPISGWIADGFDWKGEPSRTLNAAGKTAWESFTNPNKEKWTKWQRVITSAPQSGNGSVANISTELASFSFQKIELREVDNLITAISPLKTKVQYTTTEDFKKFMPNSGSYTTFKADGDSLYALSGNNYPRFTIKPEIDYANYNKFRMVVKNETASNKITFKWMSNGIEKALNYNGNISTNDTGFNSYTVDVGANTDWTGEISDFAIWGPALAIGGVLTIDTIEFYSTNVEEDSVAITVNGDGFVNYSSGKCLRGQKIALEATAFEGAIFSGWSGDISSTENPLQITVSSDMSITANFTEATPTYALTVNAINGSVSKTPNQEEYEVGTSVKLIATPKVGFRFDGWTGDAVDANDTITINMDSAITLTANFIKVNTYSINITAENGSVTKSPNADMYEEGSNITLTAKPAPNYRFTGWTGDYQGIDNPLQLSIDSNIVINALFTLITNINEPLLSDIYVAPNPSSTGIFTFNKNTEWQVYSLMGRKILEGKGTDVNISVFPKGTYLLKTEHKQFKLLYK